MELGISGKTALVLAASRGLGFGVAQALIHENVNVFICGRDPNRLETAISDLSRIGKGQVSGQVCDINIPDRLDDLLTTCRKQYGHPDILIFNNGGPPSGDPEDFSAPDYQQAFQAGFFSALHIIRKTYPGMVNNKWGRILVISSLSVRQPIDTLILSNTTRSALQSYLKTMSRKLATTGVTINAILPGPHQTDRMTALYSSLSQRENISIDEARDRFLNDIPMKRAGTIEEFGALAAFLCSVPAAYITGQAIPHAGGALRSTV